LWILSYMNGNYPRIAFIYGTVLLRKNSEFILSKGVKLNFSTISLRSPIMKKPLFVRSL
jgi:hypothetical protein